MSLNLHNNKYRNVLFLVVLMALFSCKSKTKDVVIEEKVLPAPKAMEIIHNTVVHCEEALWAALGSVNSMASEEGGELKRQLKKADSLVEIGKQRCKLSLEILAGIKEPDKEIGYKKKAIKYIEACNGFYNDNYPTATAGVRTGNDNASIPYTTVLIWTSMMLRRTFEDAGDKLREKYNIPKKTFDPGDTLDYNSP